MRRILLFGLQFPPLLLVLVLVYPTILPPYQDLVLATANPLVRSFSPPLRVERAEEGGWRVFRLGPDADKSRVFRIPGKSLKQIHLGLILLPALLLATPVPLGSRLRLLGWGALLLLATHVVSLAVFIRAWVSYQYTDPDNLMYALITLLHSVGGQVYPVVLWGALTSRFWFPGLAADPAAASAEGVGRNEPCPCGSGRKYKRCCGRTS